MESAQGADFRYLVSAGTAAVIISRSTSGGFNTYYATTDHLASTAVITDQGGSILVKESFDAFGNRRGSNWVGSPSSTDWSNIAATTRNGFTGHRMLDNLTLVHMNGRVYDPQLGRFLSADPVVQTIQESAALNPYSYVWNNPLKHVDPTGYSLWGFLKKVVKSVWNFIKDTVIDYVVRWISSWCFGYSAQCESALNFALGRTSSQSTPPSIGQVPASTGGNWAGGSYGGGQSSTDFGIETEGSFGPATGGLSDTVQSQILNAGYGGAQAGRMTTILVLEDIFSQPGWDGGHVS